MFAQFFFTVTWLWLYGGGVIGVYRQLPKTEERRFLVALSWPTRLGVLLGTMAMREPRGDPT